jgi:hypothetical protein
MKTTKLNQVTQMQSHSHRVVSISALCSMLLLVACTPTTPVVDRSFGTATKAAKDAQRIQPKYSLNKDAPKDSSREHTGALENHFNSATKPGSAIAGSGEATQSIKIED